jgi:hypothetical protein
LLLAACLNGGSHDITATLDLSLASDLSPDPLLDLSLDPVSDLSARPDLVSAPDLVLVAACSPPPAVAGSPCTEFPQCGCGAALACVLAATTGVTECVTPGTIAPYQLCSFLGDCQKGLSCVGGQCKPYCATARDCPGAQRTCRSVTDDGGNAIVGARFCTLNCNPLDPTDDTGGFSPCGTGATCLPGTQASPFSDCGGNVNPAGIQGVDCSMNPACAPGLGCGSDGTHVTCRKLCRTNGSDCPSGMSCAVGNPALFVGAVEYGYCS